MPHRNRTRHREPHLCLVLEWLQIMVLVIVQALCQWEAIFSPGYEGQPDHLMSTGRLLPSRVDSTHLKSSCQS